MQQQRDVIVLAPGEGEPIWFLDHFVTVKARERDGAQFGVGEVALPEGARTPFHRHHDEDEAFYILDGAMTLYLEGGRVVELRPGGYAHVPRGVAHGFRVDARLRMLVICAPGGFVEFVREAGMIAPRRELPPAGPPDLPRLEAASRKFRIDLLGPLPE